MSTLVTWTRVAVGSTSEIAERTGDWVEFLKEFKEILDLDVLETLGDMLALNFADKLLNISQNIK